MQSSIRLSRVRIVTITWICVLTVLMASQRSIVVGENPATLENKKSVEPQLIQKSPAYRTEKIRGRFVWFANAMKEDFGITTASEAAEKVLAIKTPEGELFPIVENVRGRAFRNDARLREMELELTVRKFEKQPFVQIVGTFEVDGGQRLEVDYWCDVCAIVMYECGPCSCCQDDNRLRKRRVVNGETLSEEADRQ